MDKEWGTLYTSTDCGNVNKCTRDLMNGELSPKIRCSFENSTVNYFTFTALHSADKFSNEQQILGLFFR